MLDSGWRRALISLAVLLTAGLAAYAPKAVKASQKADFERYYQAGCVAWRGGDIYQAGGDLEFKYLPFFAQIMSPLAGLSEYLATGRAAGPTPEGLKYGAAFWYVVLAFSYLGSLFFVVCLCGPQNAREAFWIALAALLLSVRFANDNFRLGQINMPVMFLAVFGAWAVQLNRERLGGVLFALGALIKFMPGVLLLWLLYRGKGWAVACGLLTVLAGLFWFPACNWPGNWFSHQQRVWHYIEMRQQVVTGLPQEEAAGQSLPSLTNRLLCKVNAAPLRDRKVDGESTNAPIYINFTELDAAQAKWVAMVIVLLFVVLAAWLTRHDSGQSLVRGALQFGVLFLLMLLISPEARKAHYVTLLAPGAALASYALCYRKKWPAYGLAAAFLIIVLASRETMTACGLAGLYYKLNAYGILLGVGLLLFALCLFALRDFAKADKAVAGDLQPADVNPPGNS